MTYAHKHTQLYIMYTKQLQVIDNKAVHKNFLFLSKTKKKEQKKTKPLYTRQRQVPKKHTVFRARSKHIA